MKTRFFIITGIFVSIAVIFSLILVNITNDKESEDIFSYDVEYDNLVTRHTSVSAKIAMQPFPDKVCYDINDVEFETFPEKVKEVIITAEDEILTQEQIAEYGDDRFFFEDVYYFEGVGENIPTKDALDFLKEYDSFKLVEKPTNQNIRHLDDASYHFNCDVTYNNEQYKISFRFASLYPSWENFVNINITENELGQPTIQNSDVTVYHTFNATALFSNNLDHDITLSRQDNKMIEKRGSTLDEITIPAGQSWSYMLRTWNLEGEDSHEFRSIPFVYMIQPGNMSGEITVKNYPRCMTEDEIISLYSQVGMEIIHPSYLPDGYGFECGIHNMNSLVQTVYLDDKLRSLYDDPVDAAYSRQFFLDRGIRVDHADEYILNGWTADKRYDKYQKILEQIQYSWLMTTYIDDHPVLLKVETVLDEKTGKPMHINHLEVFLDGQKSYRIQSGLPFVELKKIAESILFQDKPMQSPTISDVLIEKGASNPANQKGFLPSDIVVTLGLNNTVRWTNQGDTASYVNADSATDDARFAFTPKEKLFSQDNSSQIILPGEYIQYTFTKPGTFEYHSSPWMTGSVTVLLDEQISSGLTEQQLEINLENLKDTYKIGESIQFAVYAKGYLHDYSSPEITILQTENDEFVESKWEGGEYFTFGGPDIGYVDMRWFMDQRDFGTPTINEPGTYTMIVTLGENEIIEKFRVE